MSKISAKTSPQKNTSIIKNILLVSAILTLSLFSTPSTNQASAAQNLTIPEISTLPGPDVKDQEAGTRNMLVSKTLPRLIITIIGFVGIAALIFLVISGIRFAMAYGNEEDITKAKNQAIYAIVGLIIAMLSYVIVSIIANLDLKASNANKITATTGSEIIKLIAQNE